MKDTSKDTIKSKVDADVVQLKSELQGFMASPGNCNANYYNKSGSTHTLTDLYKCNTGTCKGSGTVAVDKYKPSSTAVQGTFPGPYTYTDRVRIRSLSVTIDNIAPPGGTSPLILSNAALTVTIDKKYFTKTEQASFIIYNTVVYNGSNVTGCPASFNSTTVY